MLLRELFEVGTDRSVAIMFGRFNPPHFGHVAAWVEASKFPAWYIGTNQSTQGPKDPLPFSIKVEAMKKLYPEIVEHLVATQTWFTLAVMAYKQHGEGTTLRVVTDDKDMKIYLPMIQKQNGVEGPHGYYKFKNIVWAEAKRKSEASLVRKAVRENNKDDFEKYALDGQPDIIVAGRSYFELVRQYLLPYMDAEEEESRKKDEREKAKAEKEWVYGTFFKVCVGVDSEKELLDIGYNAVMLGLSVKYIEETTGFDKPTVTCLAIGPDYSSEIDPVTKHLKLL